jgi:hypothetical protein
MADLPFGPFAPDRGPFNTSVIHDINNMVPTEDGYGPLPAIIPTPAIYQYLTYDNGDRITYDNGDPIIIALDWSDISGVLALPAGCIGFFAARKRDGTEAIFAGTETALYKFRNDQCVWEDVSSTTYAADCRWSFEKFGDKVYCQNGNDIEQMFDIENDTVFSDNASAPICKYLKVIGPFLFRFNIVDWPAEPSFVGPAAFMCSDHENPENNTLQDYNWCDAQFIPTGDEIMGASIVSGGAHVWLRGGVVPLSVTMDDFTFRLGDVDTTRGTSAPYSLCSFGQSRYLIYCDDGYWLYDGGFSPIGQGRINKTFLRNVDQDTFEDILVMNDPENAVLWIAYTNTSAERRMFGFQYNLGQFTASDIEVQASFVCRTFVYAGDPPITVANQPRFAIIDADGRLGYLVGDPMAASLTTNQYQASEDRSFTNMAQLDGDALDTELIVITRDIKGGATRTRAAATPSDRSGNFHFRASGRTIQFELTVAEGQEWENVAGLKGAFKKAGKS